MTNSNNDIKIVKQQVTAKSRKLTATWTVDVGEIMTALSREMQDEIDWEVLCKIDPDRKNWINLDFSDTAQKAGRDVIEAWCKETFEHGYFVFCDLVMVHSEADATLFLLKWS